MKYLLIFFSIVLFVSCTREPKTLFTSLDPEEHGISFENKLFESDTFNILTLEYIYNGGGVGIGDFNNDGLSDIVFTGNMTPSRLYINLGDFKFKDVSEQAGIVDDKRWHTGVAIADVNGDGLTDVYMCSSIKNDSILRQNLLYINQGADASGVPIFKDEAKLYGVAYGGHTTQAAFLDYDNDGDLDLYLLTNLIQKGIPTSYRPKVDDGTAFNTDVLFRNNGNKTFTDVSREAGIIHEGYGLGIAVTDFDGDGWQDLYISNDYITNDIVYMNNRNGTFTDKTKEMIGHQSQFSMGNDVADINNDGLPDIITLDMLPAGSLRRKTVINATNYSSYINNEKYGYGYQYIRNMLHLNNGDGTFSEVGQLAGIHQTEWSWSPLFADFDNDGLKDVLITNGFPKDITDKDFGNFRAETGNIATAFMLLDSIPVVKVPNYAFHNRGDLKFENVTTKWGVGEPSFSNGAAFADFDNDGDLDYVVNNINAKPFLFRNNLIKGNQNEESGHYLRLRLQGDGLNTGALGTKIFLYYDSGKVQYHDHSVVRGYISTVENIIHFGLGKTSLIDSLRIQWSNGRQSFFKQIKADTVMKIFQKNAQTPAQKDIPESKLLASSRSISFLHHEQDKIDFNVQRTIPRKFSQAGPGVAVGDVNQDGLDDVYIGGSAGQESSIFIQQRNGDFKAQRNSMKLDHLEREDQGALLFDADNDKDLDLYVVSGSFEFAPESNFLGDRLYTNDGKGNYKLNAKALPDVRSSEMCVRAADFDNDGDLDLFTGGKVLQGQYPFGAPSCILVNTGGIFRNDTDKLCPSLTNIGMINDAIWSDYDADGKLDLILAGEFMALTILKNTGSGFIQAQNTGLESYKGWWNSLCAADFDRDGDTDFVAGNLGLNNFYKASDERPLKVFAKDFDGNNSVDAILACYFEDERGEMKLFPVHFWDELNSQSPKFRRKFTRYKQYGRTSMDALLSPEEREGMVILDANYMATSYIENAGGKFNVWSLPTLTQVAPVNGMVADDFNNDGNLDVLMVGNDYGNEVFSGRYDAFTGLVLLGSGNGKFNVLPSVRSGFKVDRDAKALVRVHGQQKDFYVATQNRDSVKVFTKLTEQRQTSFKPEPLDVWGELRYADGKKERIEFYYGSGYLSQSSRSIRISNNAVELVVYNSIGKSRTIRLKDVQASR